MTGRRQHQDPDSGKMFRYWKPYDSYEMLCLKFFHHSKILSNTQSNLSFYIKSIIHMICIPFIEPSLVANFITYDRADIIV
jgi:hypothetical protein